MIKCNACGEINLFDGAAFCRKCGSSLTQTSKTEDQAQANQQQAEPRDNQDVTMSERGVSAESAIPAEATGSTQLPDFQIENEFGNQSVSSDQRETSDPNNQFDRQAGSPSRDSGIALSQPQQNSELSNMDAAGDTREPFSSLREIELPDTESSVEATADHSSQFEQVAFTTDSGSDVVAQNDRDKLISDLESKIHPVIEQSQPEKIAGLTHISDADAALVADSQSWNSGFGEQPSAMNDGTVSQSVDPGRPEPSDGARTDAAFAPIQDRSTRKQPAAFFRGSRIQLPSGTTLKAGEEVSVRSKTYVLKQRKRDMKSIGLYAALGFVVFLLVVVQIGRSRSSNYRAPLTGVVVDSNTHQVLPDVKVTIGELGKSVSTDKNGMFSFEMVPSGYYTVTAETPFFSASSVAVNHGSSQSVVGLAMSGSRNDITDENSVVLKTEPAEQREEDTTPAGAIKVTTNVEKATVYIDKKKKGVGSRKFSNIPEGLHTVVVSYDGYQPFEQTVSVAAGKTVTISADLAKIAEEPVREPTSLEYAEEAAKASTAGDWTSSIEQYSLALSKEKKPEYYIKRGEAQLHAGHKEDARKDFMSGANLYRSTGQATAAVQGYTLALELYPNDMAILRARGYAYIGGGDYEAGLSDFQTACNLDQNSYANQIGLGDAYSVLNNDKEAIKAYEKAEKLTDKKADVYALLALAHLSRGKEKDARKYYKKFQEAATPEEAQRYQSDPEWQRLKALASRD